ncbi:MAG: hypothetical protein A2Y40_09325 [Candidatus Margulisbacteria bacterium GWF2_35_9]|nr:MAG: hypothetical protein A2Y40_09325 [Candidatus Margulisbacteria bacterium GWF2_35_9]
MNDFFANGFKHIVLTYKRNTVISISCLSVFLFVFLYRFLTYLTFNTSFHDFYFFDQSIWNFVHGKGFYLSIFNMSFLGDHFYPWLLLFVPFYWLYSTPVWLFIGQAVVVLLMAYPVLRIAKEEFGNRGVFVALLLLFAYFPFRMMAHDFHGEIWLAMLVSWVLYALYYKKEKWVYLCAFLMPFAKESAASVIISIGLYYIIIKRSYLKGLFISLWGLVTSILLINVIVPYFGDGSYMYSSKYSYLGESVSDKLLTILTHPHVVFMNMVTTDKILYVFLLFAPLCFLSLRSSFIILLIGPLMQNILSDYYGFYDISAHYSITMIPVIFICAILGLAKIKKNDPDGVNRNLVKYRKIVVFFIGINILCFLFLEARSFIIPYDLKTQYKIISKIPPTASISADQRYFSHLQYRNNIYRLSSQHDSTYVLIKKYKYVTDKEFMKLMNDKKYKVLLSHLIMGTVHSENDIKENRDILNQYLSDDRYSYENKGNLWLFVKKNRHEE